MRRTAWAWGCALLAAGGSPALADTQQMVSTLCVSCHGEAGNSTVPIFPRLAGLQAEYIAKQLADFMGGKRKSDVMAPMVAQIKSADVAGLAAYYASQAPVRGTAADGARAAAGKTMYEDGNTTSGVPACAGCHQPAGAGNERYPRLAGQHAVYTQAQMQQFKAGTRNNDKARVMRAVAERMTEDEMAAVAEYLAGL